MADERSPSLPAKKDGSRSSAEAPAKVKELDDAFKVAYPPPAAQLFSQWPPPQVEHVRVSLREIGCRTDVIEQHYIDRKSKMAL